MKELSTATRATDIGLPYYFDLQAELGATKHLGGLAATDELVTLCQVTPDKALLNVGCGAGVAAAYVAENYGCHVVAVDILPRMVATAERWAQQKGVANKAITRLLCFWTDPKPCHLMTFIPDINGYMSLHQIHFHA